MNRENMEKIKRRGLLMAIVLGVAILGMLHEVSAQEDTFFSDRDERFTADDSVAVDEESEDVEKFNEELESSSGLFTFLVAFNVVNLILVLIALYMVAKVRNEISLGKNHRKR